MDVGFLGTGTMGAPMAMNVARRGHRVAVWNRSREKAEELVAASAVLPSVEMRVAVDPADAARRADVVITMLSDPAALLAVLEGPGGALAAMGPPARLVDMSTVDPATAQRIAAAARGRGVRFVDAPVTGSRRPAVDGTLLVMAAGDAADIERVRPVLEAMGRVVRVGPTGAGAALKLVVNSLGAHLMTGFASAMVLATRLGLDPQVTLDAIQSGAFSSPVFSHRGPRILDRDFSPDFTLRLMLKDVQLALATASSLSYEMPTLQAIEQVVMEAIGAGHGDEDLSAVVKRFEEQAGVEVGRR
jgi:3-hydroxyisobutyrate dehydrogenase-like beta-hydroxyacid dehydrogenase